MDDYSSDIQLAFPTYILVSAWIEVIACALVLVTALVLVRRSPVPATLGVIGALLAGVATGLNLAAYLDPADDLDHWTFSETFWQLATYGRSIGFAVIVLGLGLALLGTGSRRTPLAPE